MSLEYIKNNLASIQQQVKDSCIDAGRGTAEVNLLPVTKKQPLEKLQYLYEIGEKSFGENRVQEMNEKAERLPKDIEWHLIGSLQSNKVRSALQNASYIHSVGSIKLLNRINTVAGEDGKHPRIFLQVNITEEEQKGGFPVGKLAEAIEIAAQCKNLSLVGLMTMGAADQEKLETQMVFQQLKGLRAQYLNDYPQLTELSMGMSGDFPLAILEGSTYIRVGSLLLGAREY
jgi:pyridoxal phosphate enzyme (YggS family)